MIKPPSIQKEYTLIFSGDPALDLPEETEARDLALKVARETGNWPIKPGQEPTLFGLDPMSGMALTWMYSEMARKELTQIEIAEMSLRLTLKSVTNFGSHSVTFDTGGPFRLVSSQFINTLYSFGVDLGTPNAGRTVIGELGGVAFLRAREPVSPK